MTTSWTKQEDEQLIQWVDKGIQKGWKLHYVFLYVSQKLQRTPEDCTQRWYILKDKKWSDIEKKLVQLMQMMRKQQKEIDKIKKDMRFYELMLLEEYHLLLKLLGEEPMIRIHQV